MLHRRILIIFLFLYTQAFTQSKVNDAIWSSHYDSGYYFLNRFKPPPSMKHFQEAIRLSKGLTQWYYAAAMFGAGQATWYAGNYRNAADTVELAIKAYPARKKDEVILALRVLSNIYDELGDFEKAFVTIQRALDMNESTAEYNTVLPLVQLGKLYKNIGDLESAMHYYQQALAIHPTPGEYPYRELYHCLGGLYVAKQQFDSAAFFYRKSLIGNPLSKLIRLRLGELHILESRYDSAYSYLQPLYGEAIETGDVNLKAGTLIGLAKVMRFRGDLPVSLKLATEAFELSSQKGVYRFYEESAALLALINEEKGNAQSALYYHKLSDSLQQASASDVYKGQLFAFRQKSDAAAHAAALQALRDEKKIAQRTIIIVCMGAVLLIALVGWRYQHVRLKLKQRATESEMQALRAQMNPHFIFNCLSAINHFILDDQNDKASNYLTQFSRLVRMVLVNAGKYTISLEEELDMLRLYLEMEQLRFKDAFTYRIDIPGDLHTPDIQVPCFILQPFCENAIWHGLLHKEGKGHLDIIIQQEEKLLKVNIVDDGIGRAKAAEFNKKQYSSMGQELTASRLALFNRDPKRNLSMKVEDVLNEKKEVTGTSVSLIIKTPAYA